MRANLRRRTKSIYFKIINETAKASGDKHSNRNDNYVIDRKKSGPLSLAPSTSDKYR